MIYLLETLKTKVVSPPMELVNPPVQRGLRDVITEVTNSSEERNIGNIHASDINDANHY